MSIKDYVDGLSIDQLYNAKEKIEAKIKSIEDQKKVKLFQITDGIIVIGCFLESDIEKAKALLCELVMKHDYVANNGYGGMPLINAILVYESEVDEYLFDNEESK